MSLQDVRVKLETGLNDIYTALEEKSATIPEQKNLINVAPAIRSITGGGDNSGEYVWSKYSNYVKANENIKLLLPFDGNLIDTTGNNIATAFRGVDNPTTDNETVYGDGEFGKSFYFDGWNYVEMPYTEGINIDTGDFTIAFWIKPLQLAGIYFNLGAYINANTCLGMRCGWSGNKVFCNFTLDENNTTLNLIPDALDLTIGEWAHLAVVRKGSTFSFYKNGIKTHTAEYDGVLYNTSPTFQIGARSGWANDMEWFTNAYIDDFVLAKEALYDGNFIPTKILYEDTGTFEEYVVSDNENAYPNNDYGDDGFYYIKEIDKQEPEQPQVHNYLMLYDGTLGEAGENGANVCTDVTGGFEANNSITLGTSQPGQVKYNSDNISLYSSKEAGQPNNKASLITVNRINSSDYKKLGALVKISLINALKYTWSSLVFAQNIEFSTGEYAILFGQAHVEAMNNKKVLKSVDISNMTNKSNYIVTSVSTISGDSTASMNFYSSFLVKQDNYQPILDLAGITTTYTDETSICASQTTMTTILNNKEAIDYMVHNCTGTFMLAFLQSETALNALNASPYKVLVYQNDVWIKFLSMVA